MVCTPHTGARIPLSLPPSLSVCVPLFPVVCLCLPTCLSPNPALHMVAQKAETDLVCFLLAPEPLSDGRQMEKASEWCSPPDIVPPLCHLLHVGTRGTSPMGFYGQASWVKTLSMSDMGDMYQIVPCQGQQEFNVWTEVDTGGPRIFPPGQDTPQCRQASQRTQRPRILHSPFLHIPCRDQLMPGLRNFFSYPDVQYI
jgi:hypothetical protein